MMLYALAALAGAVAVWLAMAMTTRRRQRIEMERCLYAPQMTTRAIGVRVRHDLDNPPQVLIANLSENVPTWRALM